MSDLRIDPLRGAEHFCQKLSFFDKSGIVDLNYAETFRFCCSGLAKPFGVEGVLLVR